MSAALRPSPDDPARGRSETPIAFVQAMAQAYARRGMSPANMLQAAQITPSLLRSSNGRITALQFELATEAAMRELDDEALGWFERPLPWGSYGLLIRASLTAPTLGVALRRWCRHHGLLTHSVALRVTEEAGLAAVELSENTALGTLREFCIVSVLRNALGVACWLTDSRIPLTRTELRYEPPAHVQSYGVLFDGPCTFQAPRNALLFDAGYLNLPVRRDEAAMRRMLQRALLLTVRPYRRDRLLVEKVRQALTQFPDQSRNAQDLAARLNLSVRTLHRQLKEEGSSLQHLKDSVRREQAVALLHRSNKPLKQVAEAVGFRSEKSFMRAFKAWTGMTPEAVRSASPNPR